MASKEWSIARVKDVKETKKQGRVERKFLIEWETSYSTAKDLDRTEDELYNMYTTIRILGPAKVPQNEKLSDPKEMLWGVEETQAKSKEVDVHLLAFENVRDRYSKELIDYLMQSVTSVQN